MKKQLKAKLMKRIGPQQQKTPCYLKTARADGSTNVQGTKALSKTASYTLAFSRKLLLAWRKDTLY